ncbi:MAG: NAD-binding protein [Angelakisella sp.]
MKVIVVGAGKVGYYLTKTLLDHGHTPVVIEQDHELCSRIATELGVKCIHGDGSTIDCLEAAGVAEAQSFVTVTGSDEANLIACQLAKRVFGIKKTVSRVNNPKNLSVMKRLGVDIPISSTDNIARQLEREVDVSMIRQIMALNQGQTTISEITLPEDSEMDGVRISDLRLPEECVIISINRNGEVIIPRGKTCLAAQDVIMVLVGNNEAHNLAKALMVDVTK